MYRNTQVIVHLNHIRENVRKMKQAYPFYQYYFGVVKADSYGHYGEKPIQAILDGGCNYLAVSSLDEALEVRKHFSDIPILCLEPIATEFISIADQNHITITIDNLDDLKDILKQSFSLLKVHMKLNTGMNRLGFSNKEEINICYQMLKKDKRIQVEGIYTHIFHASNKETTEKQFQMFESLTKDIPLNEIPIVHITASDATALYPKLPYVNGCRFGIMMYGFSQDKNISLASTFTVISEVLQIQTLQKGNTVGYDGLYQAKEDNEKIAVVAIGYADGITRANRGRYVYIHGKKYPIVGNICMDMLFVYVDDQVKEHDEVIVIKDVDHINEIAHYLHTVPHEVLCSISKRVPRIYKEK